MMMWLEKKWETTDEIIKEMKPRFKYSTFILTDSGNTRLVTLWGKGENITDGRTKSSDKITSWWSNMIDVLSC